MIDEIALESPTAISPELTDAAHRLFGPGLDVARAYARHLATAAIQRGIMGPGEAPRLWERHLLNCAALVELIPSDASVVDVGSGAGLPGVALAIARPDLDITLLDSLQRRTTYLAELVATLGLQDRVRVVRARAEEHVGRYDIVTARAVAPLETLAAWTSNLAGSGGILLSIRGTRAAAELDAAAAAFRRAGWTNTAIVRCGRDLPVPTTIVREVHV